MSDEFTKHPEKDQLLAFGLGTLDPSEAEEIARHLDSCATCGETILRLGDDTFVSLVRNSPVPAPAENEVSQQVAEPQLSPQLTTDVGSGVTGSAGELTELPSELREIDEVAKSGVGGREREAGAAGRQCLGNTHDRVPPANIAGRGRCDATPRSPEPGRRDASGSAARRQDPLLRRLRIA